MVIDPRRSWTLQVDNIQPSMSGKYTCMMEFEFPSDVQIPQVQNATVDVNVEGMDDEETGEHTFLVFM